MSYKIIRTEKADAGIRKIILYIARNFGTDAAMKKLDDIERQIYILKENPYIGTVPGYLVLRRLGYRIWIVEKNLVFYKVEEDKKEVVIYAIVDQRTDYQDIINGL